MEIDDATAMTPIPSSLGMTQADVDKGASACGKAVEGKGTLSALWNKKENKMSVIDVTGDDDVVVVENQKETLEEKKDLFEIKQRQELTGEEDTAGLQQEGNGDDKIMLEQQYTDVNDYVEEPLAKDVESLKKRKRSSLEEKALEDLESLFQRDPFPSKDSKLELAGKHCIDIKRVTNWFERRRKIARASGNVLEKPAPGKNSKVVETASAPAIDQGKTEIPSMPEVLSDEALIEMVGMTRSELEADASLMRERGLLPPIEDIGSIKDQFEYSEAKLCQIVVGQSLTLTELVQLIYPLFSSNQPTEDALRASIAYLMQRKSFDPINRSIRLTESMEWKNEDHLGNGLWQWEVRNRDSLSKPFMAKAADIKRRAAKVGERLRAIDALLKLTERSGEKAEKTVDSFKKSSSLAVLEEDLKLQNNLEQLQEEKQRQKLEKEAEKARQIEEKRRRREVAEQEKEEKRKEREAAKIKAAAERAAKKQKIKAEKERLKEMKEQEIQKKKEESTLQKLAKRTGFKDKDSLNKTASKFKNFFASAAVTSKVETNGPSTDGDDLCYFDKKFPKPVGAECGSWRPSSICLNATVSSKVDQELILKEWRSSLHRCANDIRILRKEENDKYLGLPPTWAQSSGSKQAAEERMQELTGSGLSSSMVQTWRRKFIWFPADSKRPPYYGSHGAVSKYVKARKPFGKESSLDYEAMSDIDWEDEPEGSSLSRDSMKSEVANESSEEENSFFVADGYLSADEGIRSDEDEGILEDMDDIILIPDGNTPGQNDKKTTRKALTAYLEKSKRSGKPFIVSRDTISSDANHGACFHGDSALCSAFGLEILLPGALIEVPSDPHASVTSPEVKEASPVEARKVGDHAASISGSANADLLPELSMYIVKNASSTKPMLIEGFLQQYGDRKITKKWINENISLLASRSGSKWRMKEKGEVKPAMASEIASRSEVETPICTLKAPQTSEKNMGTIWFKSVNE